jgi:mannose-6-phosphate isomerase-like protein (cupin superfamily)
MNPGDIPAVLVEVQMGDYFGEDDIIRLEDDYARCTP